MKYMTSWRDIYTKHIRSLGFLDIRKGVTLQKKTLRRLGCAFVKQIGLCEHPQVTSVIRG